MPFLANKLRKKVKKITLLLLACVTSVFFLFPLYWIIASSLKSDQEIFQKPPTLYPRRIYLDGYIEQITGKFSMVMAAQNSLIIAISATTISFILAVPAAYGISRFKLPGAKTLIMIFLVTQMLPSSLLLTPLFLTFSKLKLLNTYIAPILSITTITIPFILLVLRPVFMACPASLEESARIDGCTRFTAFLHVIIPVIKPGIVTVICFGFVHGWNDLVYSLTFNTKNALFPMTTAIYSLMNEYGIRWNWVMAYGCILVAPPVLIFVTAQKYVISGMVAGAVKG